MSSLVKPESFEVWSAVPDGQDDIGNWENS
jgi:hypothetical protein